MDVHEYQDSDHRYQDDLQPDVRHRKDIIKRQLIGLLGINPGISSRGIGESNDVNISDDRLNQTVNAIDTMLEQERDKHNTYSSHKSVAVQFRTTDVVLYYFGIIYIIFASHPKNQDYSPLEAAIIGLLFSGMALQLIIGFITFVLLKATRDDICRSCTATKLNDLVMLLSVLSTIVNGALNTIYSGGVSSGLLGNNSSNI